MSRLFTIFLSLVLLGYAFLDKSFAYLGYPPVYIGEIALGFGLVALVTGGIGSAFFRSPITWCLLFFCSWGIINTIPYIERFGLNALRDGVVWLYAAFALLVAGSLLRGPAIEQPIDWYRRWMPWFLYWAPIALVVSRTFGDSLPNIPGTDLSVITVKAGDLAVHLAGAAAFIMLGLHREFFSPRSKPSALKELSWWSALWVGVVATGSVVRGGLLAVICALALIMVVKPSNRIYRFMLPACVIMIILIIVDVRIPVGAGREVSAQQITDNIESIIFPNYRIAKRLSGTSEWRMTWWNTIIDYTVFGEHFWFGKGYGINLSVDDGFVTVASRNRSPHNAAITILARSGVPGLIFWCILQVAIFTTLLRGYFAANKAGMPVLANVNLWLLAYWLACLVNMSFEVYIEGPQGGIWFWCLVGYIIALTLSQDALLQSRTQSVTGQSDGETKGQHVWDRGTL